MEHIQVSRDGALLVIILARGKANALNQAMVDELHRAIAHAASDAAIRGVVLGSASHKVFCAGFDVEEVFNYDEPTMTRFFGRFVDVLEQCRTLPKPVVVSLSGHTYAGGALLALSCDLRVMADGDVHFAINEINLGVTLPPRMIKVMSAAANAGLMRHLFLFGTPITASRAHAAGLVSELAPPSVLLDCALGRARALAEKPPLAFAAHKRALDPLGGEPMSPEERDHEVGIVMRSWFGEESRAKREALVASLKKP